jgi:phospholipid/cholesterol/gamma-HCH transport system substrate-binding protein
MEPDARHAWVGLAVLALGALLAGGLYWLSGAEEHAVKRYTVYFEKQSLEGLQINSDVRMRGITVGKVVDYAIMPGEATRVWVVLEVDARTPVLEGAEAVITRNLVTQLAAVDLDNPVQGGGGPLVAVPQGEAYPVIREGVPQITRVTDTLEELATSSQEVVVRLNTLLSDHNQQAVASALSNLDGLTGELRGIGPELSTTLASARQAAERLDTVGTEADQALKAAGARLDRTAAEAESTLAATRDTLRTVDREIHGMAVQLKLSADMGVQEIQATAQSLRLAGDALQETGRALSDPGRLLYGPSAAELGPGEER